MKARVADYAELNELKGLYDLDVQMTSCAGHTCFHYCADGTLVATYLVVGDKDVIHVYEG